MTKYTSRYIKTHCIDVFFRYDGFPIHILTDGSPIPSILNDVERNRKIQRAVTGLANWDDMNEDGVFVNQKYLDKIRNKLENGDNLERQVLLQLFLPIARLGFYSYACMEIDERGTGTYILVASPNPGTKLHMMELDLPIFNGVIKVEEADGLITCLQI